MVVMEELNVGSNPTKGVNVAETFTDLFVFFEENRHWLLTVFTSFWGSNNGSFEFNDLINIATG